mgnify:CR=1 FL=1
MPSVFAGGQVHNGGFRADQLSLTFGGVDVRGFLVQNVQFSYTQQVTLLYEIGSEFVYYVGGRAQGTATLARVIGPAPAAAQFINMFNDLCDPQDIEFDASSGCEDGTGGTYTLEDAVLTTVSVSVTAQDIVINEQLQFIFIDLEI